jgi:hypothetical protein
MPDTFEHDQFASPGDLFGSDDLVVRPTKFITALAPPPAPNGQGSANPRPKIRTNFQDPATAQLVSDSAPTPNPSVAFEGQYSGVRSMRISHQWRIDFWGSAGVTETVTATNAADPSADQLTQQYNDLLLFSYLPPQLQPTQDVFTRKATPSQRTAEVAAAVNAVLRPSTTAPAPENVSDATQILAALPPFANSLQPFCSDRIFTSVVSGTGGISVLA